MLAKGAGFLHLNTPKEINFTAGCVVTASELEAQRPRSRAGIVRLPFFMEHVRKALTETSRQLHLRPLMEDEEEAAELPPLANFKAPPAASSSASSSGCAAVAGGINIAVHHLESGKYSFTYKDHDGVLDDGVVPQIVQDKKDEAAAKLREQFTITPEAMTEAERRAYDRLFDIWRTRSTSNSASGQEHRKETGKLLPDGTTVGDGGRTTRVAHKRPRDESDGADSASTVTAATGFDDVDFMIEMAESIFR